MVGFFGSVNAITIFALHFWEEQSPSMRVADGVMGALVAATLAGALFWPKKTQVS
jgi:hypothetical protein